MNKFSTKSGLLCLGLLASATYSMHVYATEPTPPHGPPPQEALDACNNKAVGDSCSFTGRQSESITGTCRKGPDGQGPVACAPLHPPGGHGGMKTDVPATDPQKPVQ